MCGRAHQSVGAIAGGGNFLGLKVSSDCCSNDNMHPGHKACVFSGGKGGKGGKGKWDGAEKTDVAELSRMFWGVLPRGGTKNNPLPSGSGKHFQSRCFNARSEELAPLFYGLLREGKTALVPLAGFYEWKEESGPSKGSKKQPYYIHDQRDEGAPPLMAAALYKDVSTGGLDPQMIRTFCILTTATTKFSGIEWLHHRMPLLVHDRETAIEWLCVADGTEGLDVLERLRKLGSAATQLKAYPVSSALNKVGQVVEEPWKEVKLPKYASISSFWGSSSSANKKNTSSSSAEPSLPASPFRSHVVAKKKASNSSNLSDKKITKRKREDDVSGVKHDITSFFKSSKTNKK